MTEPDLELARQGIEANLKLVDAVRLRYPNDPEILELSAMARSLYAFGFLMDAKEAVEAGRPTSIKEKDVLKYRVLASYAAARRDAELALRISSSLEDHLKGKTFEEISIEELTTALATLDKDNVSSLFWLSFAWGGSIQVELDPVLATQIPKIEKMAERVAELDDQYFYGLGPHLLLGVLHGFRSPALGGAPDKALKHFDLAEKYSGVLLPRVFRAQFVYAQREEEGAFRQELNEVLNTEPKIDLILLDLIAQRKACRLLANADKSFLTDDIKIPSRCDIIPDVAPFRAE